MELGCGRVSGKWCERVAYGWRFTNVNDISIKVNPKDKRKEKGMKDKDENTCSIMIIIISASIFLIINKEKIVCHKIFQ